MWALLIALPGAPALAAVWVAPELGLGLISGLLLGFVAGVVAVFVLLIWPIDFFGDLEYVAWLVLVTIVAVLSLYGVGSRGWLVSAETTRLAALAASLMPLFITGTVLVSAVLRRRLRLLG